MLYIQEKLRELGLGSGHITENDFYRICEEYGIKAKTSKFPFSWWMTVDGDPCIVLHDRLKGSEMLFTMFHELGHHFMHGGEDLQNVYAFGSNNSAKEFEADVFAYLAICPIEVLMSGALREAEVHDPYMRGFRKQREKLYFLYGV